MFFCVCGGGGGGGGGVRMSSCACAQDIVKACSSQSMLVLFCYSYLYCVFLCTFINPCDI